MSLDLRWLVPAATVCLVAPQAYAAKYMTVEQARSSIFPLADEFVARPMQLTPEQMKEIDRISGVEGRVPQLYLWQAVAKGKPVGWLFIDQVIGKKELITYALGVDMDGVVQQMQVIEYLEVYGSQVRYPGWRDQFVGKTVKSPLRLDGDIANISGATLSSRHLTDGIRRLLFVHQSVLR
jgi:Na+-translocating ferredoxin:NAD+ oxidoreductase RnfG subunit